METVKDILNFCNTAIFYDYRNIRYIEELNQVHKCIVNIFYKTIPFSRLLVSLCIIYDIILKINCGDIEHFFESIHDLRVNIIYTLSFKKTVKDEQQTIRKDEFDENITE